MPTTQKSAILQAKETHAKIEEINLLIAQKQQNHEREIKELQNKRVILNGQLSTLLAIADR